jgi:hypothetical protein
MKRLLSDIVGSVALAGVVLLAAYKAWGCEFPIATCIQGTLLLPSTFFLLALLLVPTSARWARDGVYVAAASILCLAMVNEWLVRVGLVVPGASLRNILINLATLGGSILVADGCWRWLLGPCWRRALVTTAMLTVAIAALQRLESEPDLAVYRWDNALVMLPSAMLVLGAVLRGLLNLAVGRNQTKSVSRVAVVMGTSRGHSAAGTANKSRGTP